MYDVRCTVPDKIVTLHDFIFADLITTNYITWRGVLIINIFGYMLLLVLALEEVMEVKGQERQKREKEITTQTDTETHRTTRQRYCHWSLCRCLSVFCLCPCVRLFVDVLLSHSVTVNHNLLLHAVICHERVSYIFVVVAVAVAVAVSAALLLVLV